MKRALAVIAAVVITGCNTAGTVPPDPQIGSFKVDVVGVYQHGTQNPADVVSPCAVQYGGQAGVPADVRGSTSCPYAANVGATDVALTVTALDANGKLLSALNRPVSFKVTPGILSTVTDSSGNEIYSQRWASLDGGVVTAVVPVSRIAGDVRLWAEDEPPEVDYLDGGVAGDLSTLPQEPSDLSHAAGVTEALHFQSPTLALIQRPDNASNKSSPFVNQFVSMGLTPSGDVVTQSCDDASDPNNGKPVQMVVTGTDPQGFYVQDLTACAQKESHVSFTMDEPSGILPGTYGAIYVYNASYPEGLQPGDLLQTVAGSIQEFTSTTQLNFDSWSVLEDVRLEDASQWNKYLNLVPAVPLQLRTCGDDNTVGPYYQDVLCAQSNSNLKMESLEASVVKLTNVKFPDAFQNCDLNGDGTVPFFCGFQNQWTNCGSDAPNPDPDAAERQCYIDCTVGQGQWSSALCSEESAYRGYGQFDVELPGPGPAEAQLDDSLPKRTQKVLVGTTAKRIATAYSVGDDLNVWCDVAAHYAIGSSTVNATTSDTLLPAKTLLPHRIAGSELKVSFITDGDTGTCYVGQNPHTRLMVSTTQALPTLSLDCNENDPDANAAQQCKNLHGARFDVTGFLQQVQPSRPRWMVIARSAEDVCCRPGPGLSCPQPIQACP